MARKQVVLTCAERIVKIVHAGSTNRRGSDEDTNFYTPPIDMSGHHVEPGLALESQSSSEEEGAASTLEMSARRARFLTARGGSLEGSLHGSQACTQQKPGFPELTQPTAWAMRWIRAKFCERSGLGPS